MIPIGQFQLNCLLKYRGKSDEDTFVSNFRKILLHEPSLSLRLHCLRYFSQRALIVGRSSIHGCGLFTLIDLIEGQMLIEYTGEIIRPSLTDKRERRNEENVSRNKKRSN